MASILSQSRLDVLKGYSEAIQAELDGLQALIDLSGGGPIAWPPGSQSDLLERCTLLVWWLDVDLACYPIGPNSVVLYGTAPPI